MIDKILLAGFGGQGVLFIGKILAYAGMLDERQVCWIPSYGPEMRGGTANCSVIISDDEINSTVLEYADAGIVLNQPAYDKFLPFIRSGGTLIINGSIVDTTKRREDISIISVPAGEAATELGNHNLANMVCLGALINRLTTTNLLSIEKSIDEVVGKKKPQLMESNLAAVKFGLKY
ncbi:2-oxoacid:acceptor oxidoreductase family protein [Anaerospora sp.]|jgi:2-oxoglutarate ferredoxin oxidoreductase subunit gamma|uniref:2-oxoacid:acceptor oxidoreductase family protein n=1 Tax=Anaerospora sp. TaxID=1960278 RepID=UPI002896480F|nr:2-oxoacid:acceptor oxidoreductase family protein [Anaerospora sp.]